MSQPEYQITESFLSLHPEDVARETEMLPLDTAVALLLQLKTELAALLLKSMMPGHVSRLIALIPEKSLEHMLKEFTPYQISAILRFLKPKQRHKYFNLVRERTAAMSRLLLNYSKDTIGAWTHTDMVILPGNISVSQALNRYKSSADLYYPGYCPVINTEGRSQGVVAVHALLTNGDDAMIDTLLDNRIPSLSSGMSLQSAVQHSAWHHFDSVLVHNRYRQFIGVLHHHDLYRVHPDVKENKAPSVETDLVSLFTQSYLGVYDCMFDLLAGDQSDEQ